MSENESAKRVLRSLAKIAKESSLSINDLDTLNFNTAPINICRNYAESFS